MKIKLNDSTELTVLDTCTSTQIIAEFTSVDDLETFRAKLTTDNLSAFEYLSDEDSVVGTYMNYTFVSVSYDETDGTYTATFTIRALSDTEVKIAALEASQATQDDAIAEMSEVVYE